MVFDRNRFLSFAVIMNRIGLDNGSIYSSSKAEDDLLFYGHRIPFYKRVGLL